jgi:hypothetical protein
MHLSVDEVAVLLGADDLAVLDIVAAGQLSLHADGIPKVEVEMPIALLDSAPRG